MHTPNHIRFSDENDDNLTTRFSTLPRDVSLGLRRFPALHHYHTQVAALTQEYGSTVQSARLYAHAQRDWHVRGQTGCMFARLAARVADALRWDYVVVTEDLGDESYYAELGRAIDSAIADNACQIASLLFPYITRPSEAVHIIYSLTASTSFWLEKDIIQDGQLHLHLRYPISSRQTQAWVMAFAPFSCMPSTRHAPYFELAIRVKEKPESVFHRLNQDRSLAHLADAPLVMSPKHQEDRWQSTLRRTRMILGREPDDVTAAKSTLVIPKSAL